MAKAASADIDSGGPIDEAELAPPGRAGDGRAGDGQTGDSQAGDGQAGDSQVAAEPSGGSGLTRVTVNLTRPTAQALDKLTEATGYSKTDSINRAIQVYLIVQEIMERNSGALTITHEDGHVERVHII